MLTTAAQVAAYLGDESRVRILRDALSPDHDRVVMAGVATFWAGSVARPIGWLEESLGDWERAEACYARAIDVARRAGARLAEAGAARDCARVIARRNGNSEHAEALRWRSHADHLLAICGAPTGPEVVPRLVSASRTKTDQASGPEFGRLIRVPNGWRFAWGRREFDLPDSKGVAYLHRLLTNPDQEMHVLDLVADGEAAAPEFRTEAGARNQANARLVEGPLEAIDPEARASYRERLRELASQRAEAEAMRDLGRIESIDAEAASIEDELRRATGLSQRIRGTHASAERARKAVYNRIRSAIDRISERDEALGRHLDRSVSTGRTCVYRPERRVEWQTGEGS